MSMQEWPDDHLDELFRKSTEEFNVPFDPAHWADMSKRLDEHDRQGFFDQWRVWGGAAALVGLLLLSLWWSQKITSVAANPATKAPHSQLVISEANTLTSKKTARVAAVNAPLTAANVPTDHSSTATVPTAKETRPTNRRHTPGTVKTSHVTPDWAVRSRENTGQWRRRAATNMPASARLAQHTVASSHPAQENQRVDNQSIDHHIIDNLESTRAVDNTSSPTRNPTEPRTQRTTQARLVSNNPTRRAYTTQQPNRTPRVRNVLLAGSTTSTATTANLHRSERSPELTSSTNTLAKRSGGISDQPQQTQPTPARASDLGTVAPEQPGDMATPERLQLGMANPAFSLTAVKTTPVSDLMEPEWEDAERPAQRVQVPMQRLSVMAVWSPDLSALGFQDFTKPGSNTGLLFQYRFSNRLSVQVGGLVSVKKYKSVTDAYEWPTDPSFKWWPWPDAISGVCTMYDVPINLRYDWLLRPRGDGMPPARWFVSSGLTSYFIKHEVYTYSYDDPTDPQITHQGWDNQKAGVAGGKFGFSNLNLSLGYERPLGRHFSWQVEPFLKIPLQEIGVFRVKLLSTGAFVGLKYSL